MVTFKKKLLGVVITTLISSSCESNKGKITPSPLFSLLNSSDTGVLFKNVLTETDTLNYFNYPYLYMGGGVSVGDINNDGLQDLFFTGNMVSDALYLNKGNMEFEDVSNWSLTSGDNRWHTGSTIVDINEDGWLDIYVCVSGKKGSLKNILYVNNRDGTFTEQAGSFGIADDGHSTQATFFDYDLDGDLDLYVANYPIAPFNSSNTYYRKKMDNPLHTDSDRLYRNNGNSTFTDVTKQSGILNYGLSLSATIADMNGDGWPDVYVSNDFASPDYLYLNQQDGTFKEVIKESTGHTSYFGMGVDISDFNNDGYPDIIQADMTPSDNQRAKANMSSMDMNRFYNMVDLGMHYQYMQNSLQLNRGINIQGIPVFSDISGMAGIAATDWSWATLFIDANNDGYKDVFISNGIRKDINNKDFFKRLQERILFTKNISTAIKNDEMPSEKTANYIFKNNDNLNFSDKTQDWGLDHPGFSNGAAYADLDNDGDLDLVVNNIDETAYIYKNNTTDNEDNNYLRFQMRGNRQNPQGIGCEVNIKSGDMQQWQYLTLTRGFQSSVEPIFHFGVGNKEFIEKVLVRWPDGKEQELVNIASNQKIVIDYQNADFITDKNKNDDKKFITINGLAGVKFKHTENAYNDFAKEVLLPHKLSRFGPGIVVGDANGDGLDDFYVGNAKGQSGALYIQHKDATFRKIRGPWEQDVAYEDLGVIFFDADADGDQDLYVVSGGNEFEKKSEMLQDRLYINKDNEHFVKSETALPKIFSSGSCVRPEDYDGDGDIDLFIGGRLVPGNYPLPASSYLLRNEGGRDEKIRFTDVTKAMAPDLTDLGMVTDAVWSDFNGDGVKDLIVVGEWMPLTFLENTLNVFVDKTEKNNMNNTTGWWFSIIAEDMDGDGDDDYIAGNLGLNYKYKASEESPFNIYSGDFDNNGRRDIVLGYFQNGVEYPLRGLQCSSEQIPTIKYKFRNYNSFASATLIDVYGKRNINNALAYHAKTFASVYIENLGDKKFKTTPLPNLAQLSSINSILVDDVNKDGNKDIIVAGNLYSSEVETPRNDASVGLWLRGNGKGDFEAIPPTESGLLIQGDTKDISILNYGGKKILLAARNNDSLSVISIR